MYRYIRNMFWKVPYLVSRVRYEIGSRVNWIQDTAKYDLVFVVFEESRGWILEGICKEIAKYYGGRYCFHYSKTGLPAANAYFFAHYGFYSSCLKRNPRLWACRTFVFYTHPKGLLATSEFNYVMSKCSTLISMCSPLAENLIHNGLNGKKVSVIIGGGADPDIFKKHERVDGAVGFCTAYYPRKNPDRILDIIRALPNRNFILLGRGWKEYERFDELMGMSNFEYVETSYKYYPKFYSKMDVFVSVATLEGGPIPLIESMMCNVFPIASRTGFAPDIIIQGKNGFLFNVDSSVDTICELIEKGYSSQADIRKSVEHLTWERVSMEVQGIINDK